MTDGKIVSASLPPELVDALEDAVKDNPELSQSQVVREGLRMRLQMEQ
jgi:Arc/MetJ-type ribon-helix-helix transcriptional regulator